MQQSDMIALMQQKGVKATANRLLVLSTLARGMHPMSIGDIEGVVPSLDKSSIFRVLTLFLEHDVVHGIEDGSGSMKYELCTRRCHHGLGGHVHFHCEVCQQTFCFDNVDIPSVEIPEGYEALSVNYMLKGVCPACRRKQGK